MNLFLLLNCDILSDKTLKYVIKITILTTSKMSIISEEYILDKLKTVFKHSQFRSKEQRDAVKCVVDGKNDVYVSMPTGSGKSLVYQLPAVVAGPSKVGITELIGQHPYLAKHKSFMEWTNGHSDLHSRCSSVVNSKNIFTPSKNNSSYLLKHGRQTDKTIQRLNARTYVT